jgi:hypothetical protein
MIQVNERQLQPLLMLHNGHNSTVRSFEWDIQQQRIITAGEDSRICIWGANKTFKDQRLEPLKVEILCDAVDIVDAQPKEIPSSS